MVTHQVTAQGVLILIFSYSIPSDSVAWGVRIRVIWRHQQAGWPILDVYRISPESGDLTLAWKSCHTGSHLWWHLMTLDDISENGTTALFAYATWHLPSEKAVTGWLSRWRGDSRHLRTPGCWLGHQAIPQGGEDNPKTPQNGEDHLQFSLKHGLFTSPGPRRYVKSPPS